MKALILAGMLSARWERAADAHDEQRPPRRYYQITGAGRQAVRDAMARFPALAGVRPPAAPSPT